MSTFYTLFGENIESFINDNFINFAATHFVENVDDLKDKPVSEVAASLREAMAVKSMSSTSSTKTKNVSSNAPALITPGVPTLLGTGPINAPVIAPKAKRGTKEKPEQKWFVLTEAQTLYEQKRPVCYYVSSRGENKEKVCCANIENDPDAMKDEEPANWRCANCKDKSSDIRTKFKTGPVKGADPLKAGAVFGGNLPILPGGTGPLPNLPVHPTALPPTLSTPIPTLGALSPAKPETKPVSPVKLTSLPVLPNISVMPALPGLPNLPGKSVSPVVEQKPVAPELPEINTPVVPVIPEEPVASTASIPPPPPMPEPKPMSPRPNMTLKKHDGLKSTHYKASVTDLIEMGMIFDAKKNAEGKLVTKAIGKIPGLFNSPAAEGYEYKIEELTDSDLKAVRRYKPSMEYEYTKLTAPSDDLELEI